MQKSLKLSAAFLSILALCAGVALQRTVAQPQTKKLNVLFIVADDLNTSLSTYGDAITKSPNLDRLAKRGVKFDRAYCQYPLCSPSRTSFLSGRRPETTRIYNNATDPRTNLKDVVMLPEYFKQHGYFTARIGKIPHDTYNSLVSWDVSEDADPSAYFVPDEDGSEVADRTKPPDAERMNYRGRTGLSRDALLKQLKPGDEGGVPLTWRATNTKDEDEPDGNTARRVAKLLEANQDKPFFIAAGFHKPHLPWIAPKKYFDLYPQARMPLPATPANDRADIPAPALTHHSGDEVLTDAQRRQAIAAYHAATSLMDAGVGILLDTLDRLKLSDNTIIVFIGDHGFHLGEHGGLWRKLTLFEECARTPLIVVAPKKRANVVSPRLVEFVDIYPTLAELCGLPAPVGVEGLSFARLLDNPKQAWKKAAFTTLARRNLMGRSVRTERYRYTEWGDEMTAELYDHQTDPHEFTNLVNDPKAAPVLAEMRKTLKEGWRAAVPASLRGAATTGATRQTGKLEVIRSPHARFANLPGYWLHSMGSNHMTLKSTRAPRPLYEDAVLQAPFLRDLSWTQTATPIRSTRTALKEKQ
ncbi:MAG: sulfatase [Acidobacteria bacterium]|nr:sulfatase [Acidobacteriota bacterium]MBK9705855.1 sulfatase [Acidobacteriota bacterium]